MEQFYSERKERNYTFIYAPAGVTAPIARLDARTPQFTVNEDHELVREFVARPESRRLLEAVVVAEVLLEVYLPAADIPKQVGKDLIDRRDSLLRSLALDESYSLLVLAQAVLNASDDDKDFEIALVGSLRGLGFSAIHIGRSGTPDGIAGYTVHGMEQRTFTLEAKSSASTPALPALNFAGFDPITKAFRHKGAC